MNNNNSTNLSKINTSLFGNKGASNNGASMANSYNGFNANLQRRAAEMGNEEENEGNNSSNTGPNSVGGRRRRRTSRKTRRARKTRRVNKKSRKNRKH